MNCDIHGLLYGHTKQAIATRIIIIIIILRVSGPSPGICDWDPKLTSENPRTGKTPYYQMDGCLAAVMQCGYEYPNLPTYLPGLP